ncbi:MAG: sigma-54-dependent transcriptional regulator [Candidatus Glassbacteria bacterium]
MKLAQVYESGTTLNLNIYATPTGLWIESDGTAVRPASPQPPQTTSPRMRTGHSGDHIPSRKNYPDDFTSANVLWEIREGTRAMELSIRIEPKPLLGSIVEVCHVGPDGKSSILNADTGGRYVIQKLKSGINEVRITTSRGHNIVMLINVKQLKKIAGPKDEVADFRREFTVLSKAKRAVHKHETEYMKQGRRFVLPFEGILTLGELNEAIRIARIIGSDPLPETTLLLLGGTGSGKERFARFVYEIWRTSRCATLNGAWDIPFVSCNAGKFGGDPNIQISRLFGRVPGYLSIHDMGERGDFLEACGYEWRRTSKGWVLVKARETGVLFLDEIGNLLPEVQKILLRAIDGGEIEPLGWRPIVAAPKIVFATNQDISDADARRDLSFREDFWYRISGAILRIPSLMERRDVIPHLVYYFTKKFLEKRNLTNTIIWEAEALVAMAAYSWPGNVRQLKNVVINTLLFGRSDTIRLVDLPGDIKENYNDIKMGWRMEDWQAVMKIAAIAKEMFRKAFMVLKDASSPDWEERWQKIIDAGLKEFKSWLVRKHGVRIPEDCASDCYNYLIAWLKKESRARRILSEVVEILKDQSPKQPLSNLNEVSRGMDTYATFRRFFGLTYRTLYH